MTCPTTYAIALKAALEFAFSPDPTTGMHGAEQTIDVPQPPNIGPDDRSESAIGFICPALVGVQTSPCPGGGLE